MTTMRLSMKHSLAALSTALQRVAERHRVYLGTIYTHRVTDPSPLLNHHLEDVTSDSVRVRALGRIFQAGGAHCGGRHGPKRNMPGGLA